MRFALSLLLFATACAASPSPQPSQAAGVSSLAFPPPSASPSAAPPPALAPPTTAVELSARLLALLERARGATDLDADTLESVVAKLDRHPTDARTFGVSKKLDSSWSYNIELTGDAKTVSNRLTLSYSGDDNADMQPVCTPDYETFSKVLIGAGYVLAKQYGEHGRFISGDFTRDRVIIKLYPRGESNEKASHLCVQMLIVDAF
jgi:hypothetical protein